MSDIPWDHGIKVLLLRTGSHGDTLASAIRRVMALPRDQRTGARILTDAEVMGRQWLRLPDIESLAARPDFPG